MHYEFNSMPDILLILWYVLNSFLIDLLKDLYVSSKYNCVMFDHLFKMNKLLCNKVTTNSR